jgi:hypothetical protein
VIKGTGRALKGMTDVRGAQSVPVVSFVICMQGGSWVSMMLVKVENSVENCLLGTQKGVMCSPMYNLFTMNGILLVCIDKCCCIGSTKIIKWGMQGIQGLSTNREFNISEPKWCTMAPRG